MGEPNTEMLQDSRSGLPVALLLALAACGASGLSVSTPSDAGVDANAGASPDGSGGLSGAAAGGASGAGGVGDGELPRVAADPTLTHRIVAGRAALEGDTYDSCSNAMPARGDRWCAFGRVVSDTDTRTELWVLNFTKAATTGTLATCDGTSPDCLLLSRDLWTGFQIWGDSQPVVDRFEGDTLIFHAGPAPGGRDPYDGGIWAWRPGWPQARLLTDHGVSCFGNPRSASIACIANAKIDKDPGDPFSTPYYREFDLVAGVLGDQDAGAGVLPAVAHVTHAPDDRQWRLRFSPNGEYLAYSSVATLGSPETLRVVDMSDPGAVQPAVVLTDAAEWEIAHDGKSIYFLGGYDRSQGTEATGTLKVADFPSGANSLELTTMVRSFELVGTYDQVFRAEDRGLIAVTAVSSGLQPILMFHPRTPADVFALDAAAVSVDVASDLRHSVYFKPVLGNPVIVVTHNDGSGSCQLTADSKAESYAAGFTPNAASVAWIERLRRGTRSEQGWIARPDDCGARLQFGDHVLDYQFAGDDFVVFQGSDQTSSSWWLEYTRLHANADGSSPLPTVIKEHPDVNVHVIRDEAGTWIVFSVLPQDTEPAPGLYVHGPLQP